MNGHTWDTVSLRIGERRDRPNAGCTSHTPVEKSLTYVLCAECTIESIRKTLTMQRIDE